LQERRERDGVALFCTIGAISAQLHGWLNNAGFAIEQEYGDYNGNPVTDDSRSAVIYAKKVKMCFRRFKRFKCFLPPCRQSAILD